MARNIKKIMSILFVCMLLASTAVFALESANVKDNLGYLTDSEVKDLQESIDDIKTEWGLDTVIVITDNTEGKSSMAFADDYFDYGGYGVGAERSGILMLINMDAREMWLSTSGSGITVFNQETIDYMVEQITPELTDAKYDQACQSFLFYVDSYAYDAAPTTFVQRLGRMATNPLVYIFALIVALIATVSATLSRKGKVTINNSTYEEKGSFLLTDQQDVFLREAITKVKIQTSSGGSGTHTSSSGRSHGGGGGKF